MKRERDYFTQYSISGYNNQPYPPNINNYNIDSRLNNIEEQIKQLHDRLSKLESNINNQVTNDFNYASQMYML